MSTSCFYNGDNTQQENKCRVNKFGEKNNNTSYKIPDHVWINIDSRVKLNCSSLTAVYCLIVAQSSIQLFSSFFIELN